jgi:hypothetical protein
VAGAAYALGAATTTAFTTAADVVTALPIVTLAVLVVVRWPWRPRPFELAPGEPHGDRAPHPWRTWILLFTVVVAWELAEYAARGSRAEHPTFSSMLNAVDRTYGLKALVFLLWLCLGAAMVRAGSDEDGRRNRRAAARRGSS